MESAMNDNHPEFAQDLLRGADEITEFLFGDRKLRRRVYHLAATSNLPVFKLGSVICARKSVLLKWITDQESRRRDDNRKRTSADRPLTGRLPHSVD
jgi:hypothetical protein